jgi:hypothetical protein
MYHQLIVNGDSYMAAYAEGLGHNDLAQTLGIESARSLAIGGSANSRLIRTTLKHSYSITKPTFYVLGVGFISRWEVPIMEPSRDVLHDNTFEGRWTNPQNQDYADRWQYRWTEKETRQLIELKLMSDMFSILDRMEDLMYNLLSLSESLHSRGHKVLMYQQADNIYQEFLNHPRLKLLKNNPVFVDGLEWRAVPWQLKNGVPPMAYGTEIYQVPDDLRHPQPGCHAPLNNFLVDYIKKYQII